MFFNHFRSRIRHLFGCRAAYFVDVGHLIKDQCSNSDASITYSQRGGGTHHFVLKTPHLLTLDQQDYFSSFVVTIFGALTLIIPDIFRPRVYYTLWPAGEVEKEETPPVSKTAPEHCYSGAQIRFARRYEIDGSALDAYFREEAKRFLAAGNQDRGFSIFGQCRRNQHAETIGVCWISRGFYRGDAERHFTDTRNYRDRPES